MGLPYSRQINAAFEQVTPLVAAGFKVLRTTRDISILLAVIQVLNVFLLWWILVALIMLAYCVNPDLEPERQALITPLLRSLASISPLSILKSVLTTALFAALAAFTFYKLILVKQWVADVEYEGNVDADKALEGFSEDEEDEKLEKEAQEGKEAAEKEMKKSEEKKKKKGGK
ncbi:hypothetical protein IQ07DRAFT_573503 [Pyrenochaeta sp. DS3sAY3a]|nr:hypothetical protein IQ07DRAFT_573503 [Pyrenochaeta sp. DS3sAY3a]